MQKSLGKKGQIEIQFNWIFVIIIGAIILGFFITFIFSQQKTSEQKVSATVAKHFETIISSTNQKLGTVKTYTTPQLSVTFECDEREGIYHYSVGDVKAKDTKHELIFSSEKLTGTKIYTWTEKWSVPYQVATFLYITNDREHFSFVQQENPPTPYEKDVYEYFPKNFSVSLINKTGNSNSFENIPTTSLNKQVYTYILIESNNNNNLPELEEFVQVQDDRVRIIVVKPYSTDLFKKGLVTFFDAETYKKYIGQPPPQARTEYPNYFGRASLYAAIFAGSQERYECGMSKAMQRLRLVTLIQYYKALSVNESISNTCRDLVVGSQHIDGAAKILDDMDQALSDDGLFSSNTVKQIVEDIDRLERINNKIVVEANCPLLY